MMNYQMEMAMSNKNNKLCLPLSIKVFDVGHGDSIVIEFPDGKHIGIIDCHVHQDSHRGFGAEEWDKSEPKVLTYLRNRFENEKEKFIVDFICLSHFHYDHFRGFAQLVEKLQEWDVTINKLWDPGNSIRKPVIKQLEKCGITHEQRDFILELENFYRNLIPFKKKGMELDPLTKPQRGICKIGGVEVDVLAPNAWHCDEYRRFLGSPNLGYHAQENEISSDEHLICSAIMLKYGKAKVILGGDLTSRAWGEVINKWGDSLLRSHVVKVSHHGSKDGNSLLPSIKRGLSLWKYISLIEDGETVAVISGGYRENLPHDDTITELRNNGVETYCTGNFNRYLGQDPIWDMGLSEDVCGLLEATSCPIIEEGSSYHGDISIKIYDNGVVETTTEHDAVCL